MFETFHNKIQNKVILKHLQIRQLKSTIKLPYGETFLTWQWILPLSLFADVLSSSFNHLHWMSTEYSVQMVMEEQTGLVTLHADINAYRPHP
jgi:hypothetical protein